ncbi:hypothetical protein D1007_24373 [Hordeum vulgare]|nr:hypothetical protein D1007_24373 [Hordeum vulgare]
MFQSLGIGAIVSMIRKSNAHEDGSAATCDESASSITQAGSSDYNPKDDEVIDAEEVDDKLVKKKGKVSRKKKCANKNRRKVSETSSPMAPRRVLALSPEGSKRLPTLDEPVVARLTRQKVREDVDNSLLHKGVVDVVKSSRNGKGLEKLTRAMGAKVRIEIAEGTRRPEKPVQAAKLASEGGLIVRAHMSLLPHFKEYKKNPSLVQNYIGKVSGNFEMDKESSVIELVELWSTPRHKETCANNKVNRTKVKFVQKTGSTCYVAHVHATQEQRKGEVLSAFDIFKATHKSTKHGFSEDVQVAIPNSTHKSSRSNAAVNARVLDLQEQLEMSRQRSEVMREEMDAMKRKATEVEAAQAKRDKSYEFLPKKAEENDAKYAQLMALLEPKQETSWF